MSSIIYNGHEIQDLIINGNQAQLWLNGQKLYPTEEPAPVDTGYYFDFGNTYTLSSSTAATIDISNTPLSTGTKPYVTFYMDTTFTADYESGTRGTGLYIMGNNSGYINIGLGSNSSQTGIYARVVTGASSKNTQITRDGIGIVALKFIVHQDTDKMIAEIHYRDPGGWGYKTGIDMTAGGSNTDPHALTTLGSPGGRNGAFSATNFKARGFDTYSEALAWMES